MDRSPSDDAPPIRPTAAACSRPELLLRLVDILRGPGGTGDVLHAVCAALGPWFGVNRVGYGHVDEALDAIEYDVCWTSDASVPPLLGAFPASAFGQPVIDRLRAGQTIVIGNVREHAWTSDLGTIRTSHEVDTRAILVVPLVKEGRLRTIVYLNQREARRWTDDEVALMQDVAERTRELIERGRVEQALRESEARWRGLFERMAEGFFVAEAVRDAAGRMVDFRFLQANPAFETLTGLSASGVLGRTAKEVLGDVPRAMIDRYAAVVDGGPPDEFESRVPALRDRWYEVRARQVAPEQFSVLFLEITERKAAQLELQRAAERYRTLFESIDEGFCIVEVVFEGDRPVDYRFCEFNPAFERQAGFPCAVGRTILELVPGIDRQIIELYGRVARTGEPVRLEIQSEALGGRWFDSYAFRVGEPDQHRVAVLFTAITERKRAQLALQEREAELREAQRLAGIGSWSWNLDTDAAEQSPELRRIFGFGPDEPLPPYQAQRGTVFPPEEWDRVDAAVQAAIAGAGPYSVDVRAWRRGQPIWVIARGAAVLDRSGRVVGLRGTVQDITERKQTEQALREADARKNEFLATLAHELRNPLAPLRTGLSILNRSDGREPAAVRARALMERQLAHMVHLVDDLLDVSRVSQGKIVLKRSSASLQDLVHMAVDTSRPLIDGAAHQLRLDLPAAPLPLRVDPTRIAQVLANLLNNAAKYTPPGGEILVRAERGGPLGARVSVQDNGIGIPADMLERVFELFTQVGDARHRSEGGLGIGLSLARRLVELHGGTLRAESGGARPGSTFVLDLPLEPRAPATGERAATPPPAEDDPGAESRALRADP